MKTILFIRIMCALIILGISTLLILALLICSYKQLNNEFLKKQERNELIILGFVFMGLFCLWCYLGTI